MKRARPPSNAKLVLFQKKRPAPYLFPYDRQSLAATVGSPVDNDSARAAAAPAAAAPAAPRSRPRSRKAQINAAAAAAAQGKLCYY